jgi:hypothetical protein
LLFLLAVLVQAGLAGLFVTGDVDMLGIHEINAGLVAATLVVWIISAVLLCGRYADQRGPSPRVRRPSWWSSASWPSSTRVWWLCTFRSAWRSSDLPSG